MVKQYTVGDIEYSSLTDSEILDAIDRAIHTNDQLTIAHANAHFVVEARHNPAFKKCLEKYHLVQPDGIGVHIAAQLLRSGIKWTPHFQTGTDFYYQLLEYAHKNQKRLYFLGATDFVLHSLVAMVHKKYPGIIVVGYHHGYFEVSDASVVQQIITAKPDILLVGMGVPRQEYWIQDNSRHLSVPVCISVGAGLDFLSMVKRRAPRYFRVYGLEWLFRLIQEPRRLWRRYIIGIPKFMYIVLRQKLNG